MSSTLFVPIKFNTTVQLKPNEIGKNIDEILMIKLKSSLENTCSKHGYIKNNSIKIVKRSPGQLIVSHFNGNVLYNLQCIAEICNPANGSILKCRVKAKNALGLLAEGFYDNIAILQIIVPKLSAGMKSEINIETIKVGDEINIEVCGKKFMLYDKYISIIGKAIKNKSENINNIVDYDEQDEDKSILDDENDIDIINEIEENDDDDSATKSNIDSDEEDDEEQEDDLSLDDNEIEDEDLDEEIDDKYLGDDD